MSDQTLLLLSMIVAVPVLALFWLLLRLSSKSRLNFKLRNPFIEVSVTLAPAKPDERATETSNEI